MSRFYEMSVEISGYDPAKAKEIQAAAEAEWAFDDWWLAGTEEPGETMHASAQSNLCGGESEEEFTERLSLAVWRANGSYCSVTVGCDLFGESCPTKRTRLTKTITPD